jgi:hypothetical protein
MLEGQDVSLAVEPPAITTAITRSEAVASNHHAIAAEVYHHKHLNACILPRADVWASSSR